MKKHRPKTGNTTAKKKTKWKEVFISAFAIVSLTTTAIWIVFMLINQEPAGGRRKHRVELPPPGTILDHHKVCMASNVYMGQDQTLIDVQGQQYFSCSAHCTQQLQFGENVRMAFDPYTKKLVNKCKAYITMNPDSAGTILYFENEDNIKKYLNK